MLSRNRPLRRAVIAWLAVTAIVAALATAFLGRDGALIALAESLIWGPGGGDMTGGVLHVMGYRTAKAIERHFVHLVPWPALAREWGMSDKQCKRFADKGLDAMDYLGMVGAVRGVGRAEG